MNLAGYIRVSTGGQVDGFGPDVQREMISAWAFAHGHVITQWIEDLGVSGTIEGAERPGIGELLVLAEDGQIEGVVAAEVTRFARDLIVQETLFGLLWKRTLTVFTVTGGEIDDNSDPMRAMVRQIIGVFAQFERATIVSRMRNGRQFKLSQGGYGGGVAAYGFTVEGQGRSAELVPDETEQATVTTVLDLRRGGASLREIANRLNSERIPTKLGKTWSAAQIGRIVNREALSASA